MVSMWLPPPSALLAPPDAHAPLSQFMLRPLPPPELRLPALYGRPPARGSPIAKLSPSRASKKSFPCPHPGCSQTSSNKGNLSKHIATRHEHRKDFACPFNGCDRKFSKKYNMLRHLSASGVHRATKPGPPPPRDHRPKVRGHDRPKWTSMELDLANFLAMQCQPPVVGAM